MISNTCLMTLNALVVLHKCAIKLTVMLTVVTQRFNVVISPTKFFYVRFRLLASPISYRSIKGTL